jgi:hypothetical protein
MRFVGQRLVQAVKANDVAITQVAYHILEPRPTEFQASWAIPQDL